MKEISLEKVDQIIERTGVSYGDAREALEACEGDVLEAIIYLENMAVIEDNKKIKTETIEDLKKWLKDLIDKGNVSRIKIKKEDKEIVDVPVNAGISAGIIGLIFPPLLAFGVIAAVATKITIEITLADGSVQVVNKYISKAAKEVKGKTSVFVDKFKNKVNEVKSEIKDVKKEKKKNTEESPKIYKGDETVYSYTVTFDDNENK